jgi:hypothetical protein
MTRLSSGLATGPFACACVVIAGLVWDAKTDIPAAAAAFEDGKRSAVWHIWSRRNTAIRSLQ